MNKEEQLAALQTYFSLMSMNGGMRVFCAAQQAGIFNALGNGATTPAAVAQACGLKGRPVKLLLDGLCGLKVVEQKDGAYVPAPVMGFLSGAYNDLGGKYWDHLPAYLKSGVPMARMDNLAESEKQYRAQVMALDWMMRPSAEVAAAMLGIGRKMKGLNILDVGAGSGVWSLTFLKNDPTSIATALDWPSVLEIARASAGKLGLADRFKILPGNYHEVTLPAESFDLVILGNVTHIETEMRNKSLFGKLHAALKPGGKIVIFDVFGSQEKGVLEAALYALGLALRTERGEVHPMDRLQSLLSEVGFRNAVGRPIEVTPHTMGMLLADK
jgi:ubiquinone/menaquinone biosynthesis C-methylase UbiE